MDTKNTERKTVRISRNCDEITAHHFFKLRETGDLQWLYPKYDGWESVADRLPDNAKDYASDIADEYSKLIKNNTTLQYMDCVDDIEAAATRIYGVAIMLDAIRLRWEYMDGETRLRYIEKLKFWNFLLNPSKPLDKELERLQKQLRAAKTKLKRLEKEREQMEKGLKDKGVDIIEFKVMVQNILKRDINLNKISIKEWHYTVKSLPRKKAA